ncbi:flagellin, partial [Pseudoalteromonas sp. Z1A6]|uniref:flagellin n=1 Tax=Pseudoalteromonas sp. Z1A6 TaxID=2686349 RepID=UPI0023F7604C
SVAAEKIGSNQVNLQGAANTGFGSASAANSVGAAAYTIDGRNSATVNIAAGSSAKAGAASINEFSSSTGVTAQARTEAELVISVPGAADGTVSFSLNDEKVSYATTGNVTSDQQAMAEAINASTDEHGVTASIDNGVFTVSNNEGEDIALTNFSALDSAGANVATEVAVKAQGYDGKDDTDFDLVSGTTVAVNITGGIQLNSSETFTAASANTTLSAVASVTSKLNDVSDVDITSQKGSQDALAIIDNAIANIDSQRASLGAVQNRFDHTISNLANISENVSASRSRIQDTDFATETAEMTKNQILQQAGTSILSQA